MSNRKLMIYSTMIIASAFTFLASYQYHANCQQMATEMVERLNQCQPLVDQMLRLEEQKKGFNLLSPVDYQPGRTVTAALREAGILIANPNISVRMGKRDADGKIAMKHLNLPRLEDVDLPQLIRFLDRLIHHENYFQLQSLTLVPAPSNRTPGKEKSLWIAECDLVFFVPSS